MDPEKCFAEFLAAIESGEYLAAIESGGAVGEWMARGGFPPAAIRDCVDDIEGAVADCQSYGAPPDDILDFRFIIRPEGSVEIATGDPCYDIDHRGFIGAGAVGMMDSRGEILEAVRAAFGDALESLAQSA